MKTRNIVISIIIILAVALLCLWILIFPMRQLKQQQEEALGTVSQLSAENTASELSETARRHPLAVSLYQHKQHILISEDSGEFYEIPPAPLYHEFYQAFAPISEKGGLHYWDGSLPDGYGVRAGSWFGYERYRMEGEGSGQYLDYCMDSATGQLVYLEYATPIDMVDYAPPIEDIEYPSEAEADAYIMGNDIPQLAPDVVSRMMDAYIETLGFQRSDFGEVSFGNRLSPYDEIYSTDEHCFFSRSMRYSPEYQVYLSVCVRIYKGESLSLTMNAVSLSPQELALMLDIPTTEPDSTATAAQPISFPSYHVKGMTPLNREYFATDSGIYLIERQAYGEFELMTYFDRATATRRVLCDAPGCDHNNPGCPARREYTHDSNYLFVDGDSLYRFHVYFAPADNSIHTELIRSSLDGSSPQVIWAPEEAAREAVPDGYDWFVYWDGEELYIHWVKYESGRTNNYMLRLDPATCESRLFSQSKQGEHFLMQYCTSEGFIAEVYRNNGADRLLRMYDKELNPLGDADDSFTRNGYMRYRVMNDRIYVLNVERDSDNDGVFDTPSSLVIYELRDGDFVPIYEDTIPLGCGSSYLGQTADLITMNRQYDRSDDSPTYFVMDGSFTLTPCTLTVWNQNVEQFVSPLVRCGEDYLVFLDGSLYTNFTVGYDGIANYNPIYTPRYAFISAEDYLASLPNYRIVQDA